MNTAHPGRSKSIFAGKRKDAGGALERGNVLICQSHPARVGVVVVVAQADTPVLIDIPPRPHAGVPAVAAGLGGGEFAQVLVDVVVDVAVVVGVEKAAARRQIPLRGQVDAAIGAQQPAVQGLGGGGLVDLVAVERVLQLEVAEVRVTGFQAQRQVRAKLPTVAAQQAVTRLAATLAFAEVEVVAQVGAEAAVGRTAGAANAGIDEPVAGADRLRGQIARTVLGKGGKGREARSGYRRGERLPPRREGSCAWENSVLSLCFRVRIA